MQAETRTQQAPELDDAFEQELQQMALEVAQPPLEEPREPGLARYLKFQALDFIKHRGVAILGIALLGLWILHYNWDTEIANRATRRGGPLDPEMEARMFTEVIRGASLLLGGLGSLIAVGGIVSRDREGGHQKFLFAKPVQITRFYLQAFLVNGVGLMACAATVLLLTSLAFLRPVPMLEPLLGVASLYVGVGGLVFLLSTLVRFDLAAGLALGMLSIPLRAMAERGHWWAVATSWLLPPLYKLEAFVDTTRNSSDPTVWDGVRSMVIYGAAYIAAGVAVLKRRSIIR